MKTAKNILLVLLVLFVIFAGGFFTGRYWQDDQQIKIVEKTEIKWRDKIVYRKYTELPRETLEEQLTCYDTSAPTLDAEISGEWMHITAGLCQREWERDVKIQIAKDDKFIYYAGAAGLVAGALTMIAILR